MRVAHRTIAGTARLRVMNRHTAPVFSSELIRIGMMVLDIGLSVDEFIEQVFNYPTLRKPTNTPPTMAWEIYQATNFAKANPASRGCFL
jgi:hypothetical protein